MLSCRHEAIKALFSWWCYIHVYPNSCFRVMLNREWWLLPHQQFNNHITESLNWVAVKVIEKKYSENTQAFEAILISLSDLLINLHFVRPTGMLHVVLVELVTALLGVKSMPCLFLNRFFLRSLHCLLLSFSIFVINFALKLKHRNDDN